jgi:hypothetical protein
MPQHNGVAELLNHQLFDHVRAMLHQADLPKNLWAEAVRYAVWLKNCTSTKAIGNITPYKRLYGEKPNLGGIPKWGQHVWVHDVTNSKLDARARQAHWVGYDTDSMHAHRIYWPNTKHISVECDIKFVSPSIVVHTLPPSYTSAVMPPTAQPAPAPVALQPQQQPAPVPAPTPAQLPHMPSITRPRPIQQPPPAPHHPHVSTTIQPLTPPSLSRTASKWTDSAVMTTLSDYISHGQGPEYCCNTDSHTVKALLFSFIRCPWTLCHTRIAVLGFMTRYLV